MAAVLILTPPPPVRAAVSDAFDALPIRLNLGRNARAPMYAITLHEDPQQCRRQIVKKGSRLVPEGPAAGLWQFEQGGACAGILRHPASKQYAIELCERHGIKSTAADLWRALPTDDVLAAGAARLLLWTDHEALPDYLSAEAEEINWQIYLRTWRPGAHSRGNPAELRAKWARNWADAVYAVTHE